MVLTIDNNQIEFIGNEHIVNTFTNDGVALRQSYIFEGPSNVGKFLLATYIAEKHSRYKQNVFIIEDTSIDKIREMLDNLYSAPLGGSSCKKVVIINAPLSNISANALLKTIEEPAEHLVFIIITDDLFSLPETIISRCTRIKFTHATKEQIVSTLPQINDKDYLDFLSTTFDGRVGLAKSYADKSDYYKGLYKLYCDIRDNANRETLFGSIALLSDDSIKSCEIVLKALETLFYQTQDQSTLKKCWVISDAIHGLRANGSKTLVLDIMFLKLSKGVKK